MERIFFHVGRPLRRRNSKAAARAAEAAVRIVVKKPFFAETAATVARRIAGIQRVLARIITIRYRLPLLAAGLGTGLFAGARAGSNAETPAGSVAELLAESHAEKHQSDRADAAAAIIAAIPITHKVFPLVRNLRQLPYTAIYEKTRPFCSKDRIIIF